LPSGSARLRHSQAFRNKSELSVTEILVPLAIVVVTVVAMDLIAAWVHEHIMHGWGWGWHRSHHEDHDGTMERNDLYAVVFAGISMLLFLIGKYWVGPAWWVAVGLCVYGAIYFVVHDGLVHQRWPFRHVPRRGYLRRVYQAHRLHHAVTGREGAVSFGFVFVASPETLKRRLRAKQERRAAQADSKVV